jgi:hypothetical protein
MFAAENKKNKLWWQAIEGDCPISLTPICELPHPPFALQASGSNTPHYFDARVLASFLITSGDFINPMNRVPLARDECKDLDTHIQQYYQGSAMKSVADTFDLFKKRNLNCKSDSDQVQREETAVLQHLFQFRSWRADERRRAALNMSSGASVPASASLEAPSLIDEAFPALDGSGSSQVRLSTQRRVGASRLPVMRRPQRGAAGQTSSSSSALSQEQQQQQQQQEQSAAFPENCNARAEVMDAESNSLVAEADAQVEIETVASCERAQENGTSSYGKAKLHRNRWEPQFLNPLSSLPSDVPVDGHDLENRDVLIEEELEVLKSIYGEEEVSWTQTQDEDQRVCWQIHVNRSPWHLHLLIPGDLPYPCAACPLLCPQRDGSSFTPSQAQRLVETLGLVAQQNLGEAFIFNLVESLD